jgi:hypothetical protein
MSWAADCGESAICCRKDESNCSPGHAHAPAKAPPPATSPFIISLALWSGSTSPNTTYRLPRHGREAISEKCVPALDFAWLVTMNFLWPETLAHSGHESETFNHSPLVGYRLEWLEKAQH